LRRVSVPNRLFFASAAFAVDFLNFAAVLAESMLAVVRMHATELQLGVLGACVALGYALPCMFSGIVSERTGRRNLCLLATAGIAAVNFVEPGVTTMWGLCAAGTLRMVATGFFWPPLMAWLTETSDSESFSETLGGYNVCWAVGILLGFYVGGWSYQSLGPAAAFHLAGWSAAATFAGLLLTTPRRAEHRHAAHPMEQGDARAFVRQGLLLNLCGCFTTSLILYVFPKLVEGRLDAGVQGTLHAVRMGGTAAAFALMASTRGWHFRRWPMWLGLGALLAGLALCAASRSLPLFAVAFAVTGVGAGTAYMMSAYYALALMRTKGLAGGIQETLIGFGYFTGPMFGGVAGALASPRGALFAALIPLAAMLPAVWVRRAAAPDNPQ
jgi:predicted MFS family arabinose efflux permease